MLVMFDFGPGLMIFDRVMPLELGKKIFSANKCKTIYMAFEILAACGGSHGVTTHLNYFILINIVWESEKQ